MEKDLAHVWVSLAWSWVQLLEPLAGCGSTSTRRLPTPCPHPWHHLDIPVRVMMDSGSSPGWLLGAWRCQVGLWLPLAAVIGP